VNIELDHCVARQDLTPINLLIADCSEFICSAIYTMYHIIKKLCIEDSVFDDEKPVKLTTFNRLEESIIKDSMQIHVKSDF